MFGETILCLHKRTVSRSSSDKLNKFYRKYCCVQAILYIYLVYFEVILGMFSSMEEEDFNVILVVIGKCF